ncbi:hypothetical protein DL98DRAFT_538828 [Cadophora sp. DSE1049]|nr:hypothetical protein DL98DRAFT_538828 [Cadophora sp. DSE1049]
MSSAIQSTATALSNGTATDGPSCDSCLQPECLLVALILGLILMLLLSCFLFLCYIIGEELTPIEERYEDKLQICRKLMKDAEKLSEKRRKAFPDETSFTFKEDLLFYVDNLDKFNSNGYWKPEENEGEEGDKKCSECEKAASGCEQPDAEGKTEVFWRKIVTVSEADKAEEDDV